MLSQVYIRTLKGWFSQVALLRSSENQTTEPLATFFYYTCDFGTRNPDCIANGKDMDIL